MNDEHGDRPRGDCPCCGRRDPQTGYVCVPCRDWLPTVLYGIDEKYGRLPDVLERGVGETQRVSGTPDPSAPLNIDAEDLLTRVVRLGGLPVDVTRDTMVPATELTLVTVKMTTYEPAEGQHAWWDVEAIRQRPLVDDFGAPILRPARDQTGYLPVAQVLDAWARDWVRERRRREHRPTPAVPNLVQWLGNRLDWACDDYPYVGDFAASMRHVRGNLMAVLGEFDPPPEHCDGVQCKRCDKKMLVRAQDGSEDVLCEYPDCRKVYRREEFDDWVNHLAGYERSRRTPEEIRGLLRRRTPQADAA